MENSPTSTNMIVKPDSRTGEERRQAELPVAVDKRQNDRRVMHAPVPEEFRTAEASIVMLALLEGLADNVLGGDAWAEAIQSAHTIATKDYGVKPELFAAVVNRIMEVKGLRTKDITPQIPKDEWS